MTGNALEVKRCAECSTPIEECACCDEPDCDAAVCYGCMRVDQARARLGPHPEAGGG